MYCQGCHATHNTADQRKACLDKIGYAIFIDFLASYYQGS